MIQLITLLLLLFTSLSHAATQDPTCVAACSQWSVVLGYCHGQYGALPSEQNMTFANQFVGCLCIGSGLVNGTPAGNDSFLTAAGTCLACKETPKRIQDDLSDLLELCAVQEKNGTATNATSFMPIGYTSSGNTAGDKADQTFFGAARPRRNMMKAVGVVVTGLAIGVSLFCLL